VYVMKLYTLWNCSKRGVGGYGEEKERAHVGREYRACM
jgi:hypothetical protein